MKQHYVARMSSAIPHRCTMEERRCDSCHRHKTSSMRLVGPLRRGDPVNHMANLNGCINNGPYRQKWGQPERLARLDQRLRGLVVGRSVPSIHLPFRFDLALRARVFRVSLCCARSDRSDSGSGQNCFSRKAECCFLTHTFWNIVLGSIAILFFMGIQAMRWRAF
jgi:hypothetical protein